MKVFEQKFKIRVSKIILIALCILLIVSIIIYFLINNPGTMWGAIFGSLIAGIMAHPDFSVADLHRPCMTA